jgi:multicomponent Na+:H+ antiporter subunit E
MSFVTRVVVLTLLWLLAWGEFSSGFLLSGVAVAVLVLVALPPAQGFDLKLRFKAWGVVRFLWFVAGQLIVSNLLVAREVVTPRSRVHTGVLAYHLQTSSDEVLTLMANVTALAPGTMTVEATRQPPVVYVHFLVMHDREQAMRTLRRTEMLAVAALGVALPTPSSEDSTDASRGGGA